MFDEDLLYDELYKKHEQRNFFPLELKVKRVSDGYLYDEHEIRYLDATACLDNIPLGYSKADKETYFFHGSLASSELSFKLEKHLLSLTGLAKAYFTFSEEGCYKILCSLLGEALSKAKKSKIIAAISPYKQNCFNGSGFETVFVPLNNDSIVKSVFTKEVGAVIVETCQLAGDVTIAERKYLEFLRDICAGNKTPLIFDTGNVSPMRLGGNIFNQYPEIKPDGLLVYKGISHGVPFGTVLANGKLISGESPESSGGISSIALRAALNFLNEYNLSGMKESVSSNSSYLKKILRELSETHISLVDYRQFGFMFHVEFDFSVYELAEEALKEGLILKPLNEKSVLITPYYYFGKAYSDELGLKLDKLLDKLAGYDRLN